jgi:hypothetical protein
MIIDKEICDIPLVVCATNGDEPHERRKQGVEEGSGANNERLLRFTDEICRYPAK